MTFEEIKQRLTKDKQTYSFTPQSTNLDKLARVYKQPRIQQQSNSKTQPMRSKSGLVHYPNKTDYVHKMAVTPHSKLLNREKPLGLETKPINGLSGGLWSEMVEIEK